MFQDVKVDDTLSHELLSENIKREYFDTYLEEFLVLITAKEHECTLKQAIRNDEVLQKIKYTING